ncbi:nucleolar and coiled-body phosphoprotein 1 [Xylographa trunciseda]|nr:nucleolar and coiled-body phosphoprotein 1 [Xylographa trunciseda]
MPPKAKMHPGSSATPPVTPSKKPARPPRITRARGIAGHLQSQTGTDESAAGIQAATGASDTASTSETTNPEDVTGARVNNKGGRQAAGAKNTGETTKTPTIKESIVKKQPPAKKEPPVKNKLESQKAANLKADEASTDTESTEEEEEEEPVTVKRVPPTKLPPRTKERAGGKAPLDATDIDLPKQAEGSQNQKVPGPKQLPQTSADNRKKTQAGPSNSQGGVNGQDTLSYPDDFPSLVPLSETRFQGHGRILPVVKYNKSGKRRPNYLEDINRMRDDLRWMVPYVFHLEREHRWANEALELAREYTSVLMDQEMNKNSLLTQLMEDNRIHKKNGVEFSAEEQKKRAQLLADLQKPNRINKINDLYSKMGELKGALEYLATQDEEEFRANVLKAKAKADSKKKGEKGGKGKGKAAEIDDDDGEENEGADDDGVDADADYEDNN